MILTPEEFEKRFIDYLSAVLEEKLAKLNDPDFFSRAEKLEEVLRRLTNDPNYSQNPKEALKKFEEEFNQIYGDVVEPDFLRKSLKDFLKNFYELSDEELDKIIAEIFD